jgi:hypothetical protein
MRRVLNTYRGAGAPWPYLREIRLGTRKETAAALEAYEALQVALHDAYVHEAAQRYAEAQQAITSARQTMDLLNREAESLAARGIGVPFFAVP